MAIVLITGCSSGFGLATAIGFAQRGDSVVATARDPDRSTELRQHAEGHPNLSVLRLDVTDQTSIDTAIENTLARYGAIDVLVNNAGIGVLGALEVVDDGALRQVFETNVFGAVAVTRAALPQMRRQRGGRIVFMNAIGGILTTAYLGAYCASKHALDCFAAVFDLELRPFGIRVSSVYPSAFHTAMADKLRVVGEHDTPYAEATRAYRDGLLDRITHGPSDLHPVVEAVVEAATSAEPRLRYLVAPHLAEVLAPAAQTLDALHQRELGLTPR
jgi:NAD(P)-dependent dehydrogenase (short-subunit alcohol dehydrogenase family)